MIGAEVTFQDATGAWLTNDAANHQRIALLAFPGFVDDPDKDTHTGMHHSAFEYDALRGPQRGLPAPARARHRARRLHRPRDDPVLLLQGPRRQPRRAAGGTCSGTGEAWPGLDAHRAQVPHANPIGVFVEPEQIASEAAAGDFLRGHPRPTRGRSA